MDAVLQATKDADPRILASVVVGTIYAILANILRASAKGKPLGLSRTFNLVHNVALISFNALFLFKAFITKDLTWLWIFHYSKYWDFIDTVVLVDKAKFHAWGLHVFHHASIPYIVARGILYQTELSWIVAEINGTIHVLMYSYYLAMMVCPPAVKSAIQKRSFLLTYCQLAQFSVSAYLALRYMQTWQDSVVFGSYALIMFYMFSNFLRNRKRGAGAAGKRGAAAAADVAAKKDE